MDNQNTKLGSYKSYTLTFLGLVVLTLISTALSQINLGYLNTLLAIGLAAISAAVVLKTFMKISFDGSFFRLLAAGVFALAVLILFVAFIV